MARDEVRAFDQVGRTDRLASRTAGARVVRLPDFFES